MVDEARQILEFLRREISLDTYVNIMEQYRPTFKVSKSWNFCAGKYLRILTSTSWSSTDPPSRLEYAENTVVDLELFGLGNSFGSAIIVPGSTFLTFIFADGQNRC